MKEKTQIKIQKIKNLFKEKLSDNVNPELWEGDQKSLAEIGTSKMVMVLKKSFDKLCFEYYYGGIRTEELCEQMRKNLKRFQEDVDYYDDHN